MFDVALCLGEIMHLNFDVFWWLDIKAACPERDKRTKRTKKVYELNKCFVSEGNPSKIKENKTESNSELLFHQETNSSNISA